MNAIPQVRFILQKKSSSDTEGHILIAVTVPNEYMPIRRSIGIKIDEKHWSVEDGEIKRSCLDRDMYNIMLEKKRKEVEDGIKSAILNDQALTRSMLTALIEGKAGNTFIGFYYQHLELLRKRGRSADYMKHYESQLTLFQKFAGSISFADINYGLLERYEASMSNLAQGTRRTRMKRLLQVIKRAISNGLIKPGQIGDYRMPGAVKSKTPHLTKKELDLMFKNLLAGKYAHDVILHTVAAYFLLECYSGLRHSDWQRFEVNKMMMEEGLRLFETQKTKDYVFLPFSRFPSLKKILSYIKKHNLKYTYSIHTANKYLKAIGLDLGLKFPLSTHKARHTCGTMLAEMGLQPGTIGDVLGISYQQAMVYGHRTAQGVKNAMDQLKVKY